MAKAKGNSRKPAAFRQRVTIKTRVVKQSPVKAARILKAHIRYLERSGTGLESNGAVFFVKEGTLLTPEVRKRVGEWAADKHHFRFIISPENGIQLDLEAFAKRVMSGIERDLGTSVDWFAAAHYNTDNPHLHVVMRGKDEGGANLYIDKEYIKEGMRLMAEGLATDTLGHRTEQDVRKSIEKNLIAYRYIPLDRTFAREAFLNEAIYRVQPHSKGMSPAAAQLRSDKLTRLGHLKKAERMANS
jgi:type IV secretory pathway VirD2 relaxase